MRSSIVKIITTLLALAILAGCAGTAAANPAAQTVEAYLKAMIGKDSARLTALSCKDWEMQALLEMDGFQAVKAELEDLACSAAGTDGAATLVTCKGYIAATYNNEVQKISLERQTYRVQQEGGEWRVCGYK